MVFRWKWVFYIKNNKKICILNTGERKLKEVSFAEVLLLQSKNVMKRTRPQKKAASDSQVLQSERGQPSDEAQMKKMEINQDH